MKFFQTLIASTLGFLIAVFILFVVFFITLSSSTQQPEPYVRDNTVLKINLQGSLPAQQSSNPFDELFSTQGGVKVSLQSLRENLNKAARHDNIKGVWLEINAVSEGWANLEEAHRLIRTFRDSTDKFVYASTSDIGYNEKGYYLASAADSVFSPQESFFEFDGFYSQVSFYAGLFEKIGIEAEIARHGKYKSAVEPFYQKELSEESRYQLEQIIQDVSSTFVGAVSQKTGKSAGEINTLMNDAPSLLTRKAHQQGLIDSLLSPNDLKKLIKKRMGVEESSTLQTISNNRYYRVTPGTAGIERNSTNNKIAVIYANGPIVYGVNANAPFDNQQYITASFFEEQLEDIRGDEDVKAVVVRINSPGGSGSTSDLIWNKLRELSNEIPVIASMGPVAASGGYYIAMAADSIVAESTTLTGSIGVFSTKFNTKQLWNEELGITFDQVKSHQYADWLNPTRGFTETERKAYQQFTDDFYRIFISKVAESRNMTLEEVDAVAQGRVWTGEDALEQNLVDLLGGMEEALNIAAEKAEISDYQLLTYPKAKDFYELLMSSAQAKAKSLLGNFLLPEYEQTEKLKALFRYGKGDPLLLFPYALNIQ
ncbi:signal peptide peptidase SppA [Halalkalibaculum sp. DA384]|uniref:signal peptide peptidase SppA n=1 Tax=Halalkalibaculum sp. DA384 TaxID=3373606 RepID=UPI0037552972